MVRDTKPPTTVHQVRQFLGLCNFFRQHIKQFALKSHPLTVLTRKDCSWKNGPLPPEALKAFKELQTCLTSEPLVAFPRKDRQYALITDAATGDDTHPGGMGAILTQVDKDNKFYVSPMPVRNWRSMRKTTPRFFWKCTQPYGVWNISRII